MSALRVVVAASLAATLVGCAASPTPDGAATFRGDPSHSGVYAAEPVRAFGGVAWRFATGGPVRSSPAIAGGKVYVGSSDGTLYAIALDSGARLWSTPLGSAITSSPAVGGGRVFVQTVAGMVIALSQRDGFVLWHRATGGAKPFPWGYESGDVYASSPLLADGRVYVGTGAGDVLALDPSDGTIQWRFATEGRVRSSPAVADDVVYVGSADGSVYAIDAATGARNWRFDTEGRGLDSGRFGFDRRTVQSSPATDGKTVYVGARDGFLYAIDATTGMQRWRVDYDMSWINTSPALWHGMVLVGTSDGHYFQALDAATGEERWRHPARGAVWSSVAVADSVGYVGDGAGSLYAFDAATGAPLWEYRAGGGIRDAPVAADGLVVFGSEDGGIYALRAGEDGGLQRVVFWDSAYTRSAWIRGAERTRDVLGSRGYTILGADSLAAWMSRAIDGATARRSVAVFAIDHVPPPLLAPHDSVALMRRFLDAGGTIVWPGTPPLIWPRDPATGDPGAYANVDRAAAGRLLGVDFRQANFDRWGSFPTQTGRRWGLDGWWTAPWGVDRRSVDAALATDENDLATAWIERYGVDRRGAFIMLGRGSAGVPPEVLAGVAEHRGT